MMGQAVGQQDRLFYEFNLDERVSADHLLRRIDAVLDLGWVRGELAPYYSHTGCPSIDPELMIRMLLVGYCYSIRSERRLCQDVALNLAYRWFCRLGLKDKVPSYGTFSVNRHGRLAESNWTPDQFSCLAIKEYIEALESENLPIHPRQKPKAMSPTDPCAAWTTRGRHKVMFVYSLNYLIDMENAVILDVEETPTRISKRVTILPPIPVAA